MKDRIIVHLCCGVDAVWPLRFLKENYPNSDIVGYFYDPNIHPEEEYELRWIETLRVCNELGIDCIKGEYDVENWIRVTKGFENEPERGKRCTICHDLRLEETAKLGKKLGFNKMTTILMMSPKKDFEVLSEVGKSIGEKYGLEFLPIDFKKNGGVEKMNKLSKEAQIYRQNYCGCIYGLFQYKGDEEIIPELTSYGKGRLPGSREELLFIKKLRLFAEGLGIPVKEQSFSFIGWRLIKSVLKIDKEPVNHLILPYSRSIKGVLKGRVETVSHGKNFDVYKINKGNVELWRFDKLKNIPLKDIRYTTNPVVIIDMEVNLNSKVEIQINSEFSYDMSSVNLIIGSSGDIREYYSDTFADGTGGWDIDVIKEDIVENREKILSGKKRIIIFGGELIGQIGKKVYYGMNKY